MNQKQLDELAPMLTAIGKFIAERLDCVAKPITDRLTSLENRLAAIDLPVGTKTISTVKDANGNLTATVTETVGARLGSIETRLAELEAGNKPAVKPRIRVAARREEAA